MIPAVPGCTWVISLNFQNLMFFMKFPSVPPEESASHTSPPPRRGAPSLKNTILLTDSKMCVLNTKDFNDIRCHNMRKLQ